MKSAHCGILALFIACTSLTSGAAVRYVDVNSTNATPPFTNWASAAATIQDAVDLAMLGDQILVTDGLYQTGGSMSSDNTTNRVAVTNQLTIQSVNGPSVTVIDGAHMLRCVYLADGAVLTGFTLTGGSTGGYGGGILCESTNVLISNCLIKDSGALLGAGVYSGMLSNCIVAGNAAAAGGGTSYAVLNNCTVTNNAAAQTSGGGALGGTLNNCVLAGNSASYDGGGARDSVLNHCTISGNTASSGGGAQTCTLNQCILTGNKAAWGGGAIGSTLNECLVVNNTATIASPSGGRVALGGGVWGSIANNCTIVGNSVSFFTGSGGGGTYAGTLNNCIIYGNSGPSITANYYGGALNYCCTVPLPAAGEGNFSSPPLFVNQAGANFRLQTNSPCINGGNNSFLPNSADLEGNPRVVGSTIDVGAYEFQSPQSAISYAWLQQYGLPTDGSADFADSDGEGMNNWQEWRAETVPTNALSALRMLAPTGHVSGVTVRWESVSARRYWLDRATSLSAQPAFSTIATNLLGQVGTTTYTDTNAVGTGPFFYRVGVQE